ncbi:MAG: hypothetical protein QM621_13495 [Aeromicrobium sp.]|uniref:hypothetical protein n=1 Tax=Aeromicrobium sp. TaxID=1871063 RepID=UPI0039E433BE
MRSRVVLRKRAERAAVVTTALALLVMAGCSIFAPTPPSPSRVLQSVDVVLDSDGAISTIEGSAVYVDEMSGETRSELTDYDAAEVVDDLPVRVTTEYRSDEGAGSDLEDLAGYTGRVTIEIQLENLTVAPAEVTYDAAGQAHKTPALIGTPLSIAASTTLKGLRPSDLVLSDGEQGTTGVVSATPDGGSAVQWAALLAPPQTEATARFTLVADVDDFEVPDFDIAVQAGLHTDLSFDGVVSSAFGTPATSELVLQQRAIGLVADVNDVLYRAGTTINEVRTNLDDTSKTLGQRAAQRLQDSTQSLTSEMQALGMQLTALDSHLAGTVSTTQSQMTSQLTQIVTSMHAMLGDTTGTVPDLGGDGCAAQVSSSGEVSTVYQMFLQLAGQLNGYADASEACKVNILAEITNTLGPASPDQNVCAGDAEDSATCALFRAKQTVLSSTVDLVAMGENLVTALGGDKVRDARATQSALHTEIGLLESTLGALNPNGSATTVQAELTALLDYLDTAADSVSAISDIRDEALTARDALEPDEPVAPSHAALADDICDFVGDELTQDEADPVLDQIVSASWCDDRSDPATAEVASGSLEANRRAQIAHWDSIATLVDPAEPGSAVQQLDEVLSEIEDRVNAALTQANTSGTPSGPLAIDIAGLLALVTNAKTLSEDLDTKLGEAETQQDALDQAVRDGFNNAADELGDEAGSDLDEEILRVTNRADLGKTHIAASFTNTVNQLRGSSTTLVDEAKAGIESQKSDLETTRTSAVNTLDERTTSALSNINQATAGATTDVEAASALLSDSLSRVLLDLGDPKVQGSGILGSMTASAAKSGTADYQLALASQHAAGFANVRSEDIAGILLRQAQFRAALDSANYFPPFHLEIPEGATSQTIYAFRLSGGDA